MLLHRNLRFSLLITTWSILFRCDGLETPVLGGASFIVLEYFRAN
jgi:hypothetical protein